ncbi:MAG: type 4a pilus biogenesis protein PilO [Candidatus Omnitrophica bacterium]|nr:type 4a pilus biogenesis protein PilO [Candidatus Omnitrophota bacterium]
MDIKGRSIALLAKFQSDNKRLALLVVVSLLFLYVNCFIIIKGKFNVIREKQRKIQQLKKDFDAFSKDLARMQNMQKGNKSVSVHSQIKRKNLASEEELALLLKEISDLADKNKVIILQINPIKETSAGSKVSSGQSTSLLINLEAIGGYHELGYFINDLENAPIFLSVSEMRITPKEGDYRYQKIILRLRTYVKK